MLARCFGLLFAIFAVPLWAASPPPVTGPADLYFLAVGMANPLDSDQGNLREAANSAGLVARTLSQAGARYGILLASEPGTDERVTRDDVASALRRLKARIREDRPVAPRVLVYLMAHGVSDPTADYVMLIPDNLRLDPGPVAQEQVFRLARRSVFDIDLRAALMDFRIDPRLAWLDDMLYSDRFSELPGPAGLLEHYRNQQRLDDEMAQHQRGYGPAPFENAPIPFVLLTDNCNDGFANDLAQTNVIFSWIVNEVNDATLDIGVSFRAAAPGRFAVTLPLPSDLADPQDLVPLEGGAVTPVVGPLAVHLQAVLRQRPAGRPFSLAEFAAAFAADGGDDPFDTPQAYRVAGPLRPDVAGVEFFPAAPQATPGPVDLIRPQGAQSISCCSR